MFDKASNWVQNYDRELAKEYLEHRVRNIE
jgi:hypothetical protein